MTEDLIDRSDLRPLFAAIGMVAVMGTHLEIALADLNEALLNSHNARGRGFDSVGVATTIDHTAPPITRTTRTTRTLKPPKIVVIAFS